MSNVDARRAASALYKLLEHAESLPLPGDVEAPLPESHAARVHELEGRPTVSAYVHRVPGYRLWLWYRVSGAEVRLVTLTTAAPFPS